eukprot:1304043-Amphidinium_carterae.1
MLVSEKGAHVDIAEMASDWMSNVLKIAFWWGLRKHPPPMLRLQRGASEDSEQINLTQNMH